MAKNATITTAKTFHPEFCADFLNREHLMPHGARVDYAQFLAEDGTKVTLTANAAQNAVSIAVTALTNAVPSGTLLYFGAGKYARTTAAAAVGANTVAVEALPVALSNGDSATYAGTGRVLIQGGTPVGRTYTERDANTLFGPAVDTDDEFYLVAWDVTDAKTDDYVTLIRPGTLIKENKLPGWTGMTSQVKAKIRSVYRTITGGA